MSDTRVTCPVCMHHCELAPGQTGLCRARRSDGKAVVCDNYGRVTSLALDPIEKKPLRRYHPGSMLLSVGSYGCNLRCPFCQNHEISMCGPETIDTIFISPEELAIRAESLRPHGCIGIAFTYNEPLIGYEYVRDSSREARKRGLFTVAVTNGSVTEEALSEILPYLDAMNVDLKSFTDSYYRKLGGDLTTVKSFIRMAALQCHIEVTTLIVPGENDCPEEMDELSAWLSNLSPDIALHVSRFFPRFHMTEKPPTPVSKIYELADRARKHLKYVYTGNC